MPFWGQYKDKKKVGEVQILALHKFFNTEKEKENLCLLQTAQRDRGGAGQTCPEVVSWTPVEQRWVTMQPSGEKRDAASSREPWHGAMQMGVLRPWLSSFD